MIVYILTFALSLIGVRMADLWYDDTRKFISYSILAVMPPILIAGLRDYSVGFDVEVYVTIFNGIANNGQNLIEFLESYPAIEVGYLFLTFVVAQLTDQYFVLLFLVHILIIIPLYVTAMKWREYLSPTLFMFVFYMIFFQESLSIVRQSLSMSFSILGFTLFLEKKHIHFVVCMIIAYLFHQTAIIALSFPIVYYVVDRYSFRETYKIYVVLVLLIVMLFVNLDSILIWMIENGYIDFKFLKYTTADNTFVPVLGAANFVVKIVTIAFIIYILFLYNFDTFIKFVLVMALLDMVFSLCALITQPLDRLSLYYRLMSCISIPYLIHNYPVLFLDKDVPYRKPVVSMFCILLFAYWFYVYILGDYDQTSDYQFSNTLFLWYT